MPTLTAKKLNEYLEKSIDQDALVITPLLSQKQIGEASIDIRLGNQFIVFRTHALGSLSHAEKAEDLHRVQERQVVKFGKEFVLHPGMLALGSTFEYVSIPPDLECQVEGRSSWARVRLQIATANTVEPNFKGVITLELSNVGTIPIKLTPGIRIAQLVFHTAEPNAETTSKDRKYHRAIGPEFSKVYTEDKDFNIFLEKHDSEARERQKSKSSNSNPPEES